jgi:hypothetical protein
MAGFVAAGMLHFPVVSQVQKIRPSQTVEHQGWNLRLGR